MGKLWRLLQSGLLILQPLCEENLRKCGPYRVAILDTEPLYNPVWKASRSPHSHVHDCSYNAYASQIMVWP